MPEPPCWISLGEHTDYDRVMQAQSPASPCKPMLHASSSTHIQLIGTYLNIHGQREYSQKNICIFYYKHTLYLCNKIAAAAATPAALGVELSKTSVGVSNRHTTRFSKGIIEIITLKKKLVERTYE